MVFTTFTQPLLTGVILKNLKMSSERYCFSEFEKVISFEMLALHKIFWNVKKKKKKKKKRFLKYKLFDKTTGKNVDTALLIYIMSQSDELFTNISM